MSKEVYDEFSGYNLRTKEILDFSFSARTRVIVVPPPMF